MSDILAYAALALALLSGAAFFWTLGWIRNRLARLFAGGSGESLGDALGDQGARLVQLEQQVRELTGRQKAEAQDLAARLASADQDWRTRVEELAGYAAGALRHVHLHSYAVGNGGPESAVVVLVDDAGNGLLWTVLAGKALRFYTRLVRGWRAEQLAQDEEQALQEARAQAGPGAQKEKSDGKPSDPTGTIGRDPGAGTAGR